MEFTFSTARLLIQTEFAPIVSIFVLIAFIKTNVSFSDSINRTFLFACASSILLTVSDSVRFISAHLDYPTIYRYISAGTGYTLRVLILYLITIISARYKTKINLFYCKISSSLPPIATGKGRIVCCSKRIRQLFLIYSQ